MARNVKIISKQKSTLAVSGSDRVIFVDDISKIGARSVIAAVPISTSSFPRLKNIGSTFHRIRYKSLDFEMVPQLGTSTSGGYVMGFVKDVTEDIPEGEAGLSVLFSQTGSIAGSDWQPSTLRVNRMPDLYYTEWNDTEPRWSSPGKFVMMTDGKASQPGSFAVYCHWSVVLSEPEYEVGNTQNKPLEVQNDIMMNAGTKNLKVEGKDDDLSLWLKNIPGITKGDIYKLPSEKYYLINKSNAIDGLVGFNYIQLQDNNYLLPLDDKYNIILHLTYRDVLVLEKGDLITLHKKNSENLFLGSQYICRAQIENCLNPLEKTKENLENRLPICSEQKLKANMSLENTPISNFDFSKTFLQCLKLLTSSKTMYSKLRDQWRLLYPALLQGRLSYRQFCKHIASSEISKFVSPEDFHYMWNENLVEPERFKKCEENVALWKMERFRCLARIKCPPSSDSEYSVISSDEEDEI